MIPKKDSSSGYRYYSDEDIDKLQQILIYKELGLELAEIKPLIESLDTEAKLIHLNHHLEALKDRQAKISTILSTVSKTIQAIKGEITMKNDQKFEGLKASLIKENDQKYQEEVVSKYGKDAYETSRNAFKTMSKETFDHMNQVNETLIQTLIALKKDLNNEELEQKVFSLHKEWISITWNNYNKDAHRGVTEMYVSDERFMRYYDQHEEGIAKLLRDTVHKYLDRD